MTPWVFQCAKRLECVRLSSGFPALSEEYRFAVLDSTGKPDALQRLRAESRTLENFNSAPDRPTAQRDSVLPIHLFYCQLDTTILLIGSCKFAHSQFFSSDWR